MTPGILAVRRARIEHGIHEYEHDPNTGSYGLEAVEKLGVDPAEIFKTLIVELSSGQLVAAVIPVLRNLDLKVVASVLGARKAKMAEPKMVERVTGYVLGGVSPLGQKKPLGTLIDESARELSRIYVSGGRRGLDISLSPSHLCGLINARYAAIARPGSS